jgi:acylphosphatase
LEGEEVSRGLHLVVSGRVQGVGYRWFARGAGRELGLAGRVRNLPDGRVDIRVAGEPERLAAFIDRLREGPPASRVTAIDESELSPVPSWDGFDIER